MSKLSHLSESQVEDLMTRYYAGESTYILIKDYSIKVSPSALYKEFPPLKISNYSCEYCGKPLVVNRHSKKCENAPYYEKNIFCTSCGHKPFDDTCNCTGCVQSRIDENNERLRIIQEHYANPPTKLDFSQLSFEEKVYLGAICRALLKENLFEIAPAFETNCVLAPTEALCSEMYKILIEKHILAVSPTTPLVAFDIESNNFPNDFSIYRVTYNLNLVFPPNKQEFFKELFDPCFYSSTNIDKAYLLWRKLALAECIEYLQYSLSKVNFNFSPGQKSYATFDMLLNDFSVAQIYGIIWRAVADASKLFLEKSMSKQHAANCVIGTCERYAERAKNYHWNLKNYRRERDNPQSTLSMYFFNRVLGIGDIGFEAAPNIEWLR